MNISVIPKVNLTRGRKKRAKERRRRDEDKGVCSTMLICLEREIERKTGRGCRDVFECA